MKISAFTTDELDLFRNKCSFTDNERQCFEMKVKDATDIEIAFALNVSDSTVSVIKRKMRTKIDEVLRTYVRKANYPQNYQQCNGCKPPISHTMTEWAKLPDMISIKGQEYIYEDYRTEGDINYPRAKMGDGVHYISELPFYTSCITEEDIERWDNKPDTTCNDFGTVVDIDDKYKGEDRFKFPSDGYLMLEFDGSDDYAKVFIYGASGTMSFAFEKPPYINIHSKEVFVRKGMRCEYHDASKGAHVKFVPLV
jgi:DNA-binding CsgD family transcriptional regulator